MISKIFINVKKCKSLYRVKISSHYNLGITLQELGRLEEAETSHRKAIALKPNYANAYYSLGLLLFEAKQYEKAAEQLTTALPKIS